MRQTREEASIKVYLQPDDGRFGISGCFARYLNVITFNIVLHFGEIKAIHYLRRDPDDRQGTGLYGIVGRRRS